MTAEPWAASWISPSTSPCEGSRLPMDREPRAACCLADVEATGPLALELAPPAVPMLRPPPRTMFQWVDTPRTLHAVSEELRAADIIGLDVEAALAIGTLCLLQAATRIRTFLIDPLAVGDLKPVVDVLCGGTPLEVIHNARFNRRILAAMRIVLDSVFDTLEATRRFYRSASAAIWA